jgi:DNA-binding beta-propeller fold protein YncE
MIRIDFERTHLIKLTTGESVWVHRGVFGHTAIGSGSGAGTIDDPTGMDVDSDGNIYFSQHGESFPIHKIRPVSANAWTIYPSVFQPGTNEIMDLWDTTLVINEASVDTFLTRFDTPYDVAVDQNQFVYVANTGSQEIQVYNTSGMFFLKAGVESMTIDTSYWVVSGNDSSLVDTFYVKESHGDLISPRAITVDNRGMIYVCDPAQSSIFRYQLSNQLDEDLQPLD